MFEVTVSLSGGSAPFSKNFSVADKVSLRKVDRALTKALKELNDAPLDGPKGGGSDADVTFSYDVKKGGALYCVSHTTWFNMPDAFHAPLSAIFSKVAPK